MLTGLQLARVKANAKYSKDDCPTCANKGSYLCNGEVVSCDCSLQIRLQRAYLGANIPAKYHTLGFDDFFEGFKEQGEIVRSYVEKFEDYYYYGKGITFCGPLGTGKSFAASLIAKELVKQGRHCLFVPFSDLLDYQRRQWDDQSNQEFDEARNVELLVIDELSDATTDRQKEFLANVLERIVRHRVSFNLPTIITTNISKEREKKTYPRVFSLLSSCQDRYKIDGEDQRILLVGKDTRKKAQESERRPII